MTSIDNRPMDSVQIGKAVFLKENYTSMGFQPRAISYSGRYSLMRKHIDLFADDQACPLPLLVGLARELSMGYTKLYLLQDKINLLSSRISDS